MRAPHDVLERFVHLSESPRLGWQLALDVWRTKHGFQGHPALLHQQPHIQRGG
jgi:hypothetical protein